jgi:5-carboxymethyl-2-hydroxymuconate isomerase
MPHFVVEYARRMEETVSLAKVMETTYAAGARSGVMTPSDIKVRAVPYDHFLMADGTGAFLHVTVSLLAGRSAEQKEHLGICVRDDLAAAFPEVGSISVDIRDMDPVAYKKRLLPVAGVVAQ